jgi:hypothetical protein
LESIDDAHRTVGLRGDIVVVFILAAFMVDAGAEVFRSVLVLYTFMIAQEISDVFAARDVFFFYLMLALVERRPTGIAEMLFVI